MVGSFFICYKLSSLRFWRHGTPGVLKFVFPPPVEKGKRWPEYWPVIWQDPNLISLSVFNASKFIFSQPQWPFTGNWIQRQTDQHLETFRTSRLPLRIWGCGNRGQKRFWWRWRRKQSSVWVYLPHHPRYHEISCQVFRYTCGRLWVRISPNIPDRNGVKTMPCWLFSPPWSDSCSFKCNITHNCPSLSWLCVSDLIQSCQRLLYLLPLVIAPSL